MSADPALSRLLQRLDQDDEFSGTGLGVAISKRIEERYQGRIWAQSEVGVGATFYFMPKQYTSSR